MVIRTGSAVTFLTGWTLCWQFFPTSSSIYTNPLSSGLCSQSTYDNERSRILASLDCVKQPYGRRQNASWQYARAGRSRLFAIPLCHTLFPLHQRQLSGREARGGAIFRRRSVQQLPNPINFLSSGPSALELFSRHDARARVVTLFRGSPPLILHLSLVSNASPKSTVEERLWT